jgi:5-hydroxyisourate hydrolase
LSGVSTHVLDTARGRPAAGISVALEMRAGSDWTRLADTATDESGRAANLVPSTGLFQRGTYRLRFDAAAYFRAQGLETFYAEVSVTFEVRNPGEHYHVPLLLSPWGYTTYRGS